MMKLIPKLVLIVLILSLALPTLAQETTTYNDPEGRFNAQIPAGWTDENTTEYVTFSKDNLLMQLVTVETDTVQAGIEAALALARPDLTDEPVQTNDIPAPNGVWTQHVYILEDGSIVAALGQLVEGTAYVLIFQAPDQEALQSNISDLNNTLLGITIGEQLDLTGIEPRPLTETDLAELRDYVDEKLEQYNVPGAAVAIVQNGEVIFAEGFGVADLETGQPVDADTLFMVGSIGKSMTTMMMGTLVDDGILDWNTPVVDILPSFAVSDAEVTPELRVRDLVNHASGVQRWDIPLLLLKDTPEQVIESIAAIPMNAKPGEQFNYSNQMVAVGGYIAAIAAGATYGEDLYQTYDQLMRERIFEPIGMDSATLSVDEALADENLALPHVYDMTTGEQTTIPIDFERFGEPIAPAGAPWSNANEMALYALTAMNEGTAPNGTQIISAENLAEAQTAGITMGGNAYYGMGWIADKYNGLDLVWHNGGTSGFSSDLAFLPDADLGVVVLSNASGASNFVNSIREYVFEQAFDLEHSADARYTAVQAQMEDMIRLMTEDAQFVTPEPSSVEIYVGEYERGITVGYNEAGEFALGTHYGTVPMFAVEGVEGAFLAANGFSVEIAEKDGALEMTIGLFADPTQSIVLKKVE
jgi:CubicO group peptidase (beta-lactamase class C family)